MSEPEFEPTCVMRWVRPNFTTSAPDALQQQWRKPTFNGFGHLSGYEYEWRVVPLEIVGNP